MHVSMSSPPSDPPGKDMTWVAPGSFLMGSGDFYPEEGPVRTVTCAGFWIDQHPVTVADFARFVRTTGYETSAERAPDPADYPGADPAVLVPGSLVFRKATGPVDLRDLHNWWEWVPGANWRRPEGPGSNIGGRERHPVVHIAYADAEAYATWLGKVLPTESEWEYAARGGLEGATFAWGDEFAPRGRMMANTWQGEFPWQNLRTDGFEGTSPVRRYPPNGYGLYDVTGNVWEWTTGRFASASDRPCCSPPPQTAVSASYRVIKGGSHLCAPNYCLRYRPAARQAQAVDTSTSHIGFRCIARPVS